MRDRIARRLCVIRRKQEISDKLAVIECICALWDSEETCSVNLELADAALEIVGESHAT